MQARHPKSYLPLRFSLLTRKKTAFMASESSCVYIFGNSHKSFLKCIAPKQITGICFFYSVCHEKRSLNQMCFLLFLLHSLLLIIQTYSVFRLHKYKSDTQLARLPVGSGNPALSVTVIFFMVEDSTTCNLWVRLYIKISRLAIEQKINFSISSLLPVWAVTHSSSVWLCPDRNASFPHTQYK